ncbi:MetQ/NlpA family ABC transporter substrate-binding protein [Enterococcus dongliensis]|uniref:Lipoprotein n=1 Tax=Enterococcus dongliensis TaxID=2559925 RepID=A0AAW8TMY3_9ENTE|nr:MetQ/NlpA family ABC transporter substrate-binding protein [Enterococcus dongliensis]MDT2634867.1 MetQ/NlpA family ABC transporter substrate-binding protein [Enterococcus dongliensis]MDT2638012.1 MetQ/NlpA family ABC transporter substrate-binding protein [Enterococcus dongliensis]MDT2643045.1 MetQ/NlpA family ABC transporter substrate-binding protein [Enterococcus dongliensis]
MKKLGKGILLSVAVLAVGGLLAGCGSKDEAKPLDEKKVTIGVTSGPHQQIIEEVARQAKKDDIEINVKSFDDYNTPNSALSDGDLDGNSYQTFSFLEQQVKDKDYKIESAFKTVAFPLGVYSKKITDLSKLQSGDKIGVPNDPTNEYRALKLLEEAGVLKLKDGVEVKATKNDVDKNPKNIEIVELEASQIPSQLDELAAAAINTNFAFGAGLTINDDAIYNEPLKDNPNYNVFAVRTENKDDKIVKEIKKYYQSDETKKFIEKEFKGSVVPAF